MNISCNIASSDFINQVEKIEPSISYGGQLLRPCCLVLTNGKIVERAICVEDHRGFHTDAWIHPQDVDKIKSSDYRMPARLASELYKAGESGMGYEIFMMQMRDLKQFVFVTGNTVDFPDIPEGYTSEDILKVYPHQGREQSKQGYRSEKDFKWCFYVKE